MISLKKTKIPYIVHVITKAWGICFKNKIMPMPDNMPLITAEGK